MVAFDPKKLNIKIVTQTFPPKKGGMQSVMGSIAYLLEKEFNQISIYPDHKITTWKNCKIYNVYSPKFFRPLIKKLIISISSDNKDIVICDSWKSIKAVPRKINFIILLAHGQEFLNYSKNHKSIQTALNRCNYLVASSNYTLNLIRSSWVLEKNKGKVIYPTYSLVDKDIMKNHQSKGYIKLLSICRIEKRKGLLEVASCLSNFKNILPKFKWHIAGKGPFKKELKDFVYKSNISKDVIFENEVNEKEKEKLYETSDLFIMPSYKFNNSVEGFGISYIEAASYGIPSISGIDGGSAEAVIDKKTGWCVNTLNEKELLLSILEAMKNKKQRENFGVNAKKRFKNNLNSELTIRKLISLIIKS